MKHVVITGAYGGMGKAVTNIFKENGYHVFALDKNVGLAEERVTPVQVDVTSLESVESAVKFVKERCCSIYAVLHFAGIYTLNSLLEIDDAVFTKAFDVNLFGAFRVNKAFVPLIEKGGRILITTSELAPLAPLPFTGVYAVTKTALDNYAYSLRMEVQLLGVKVSVLRPGAVKTDMLGVSTSDLDKFVSNTELYKVNATRFKNIVDSVESRNVTPEKIAKKSLKIIKSKHPKQVYSINRNPLLLLLNILPKRLQTYIIKKILSDKKR